MGKDQFGKGGLVWILLCARQELEIRIQHFLMKITKPTWAYNSLGTLANLGVAHNR